MGTRGLWLAALLAGAALAQDKDAPAQSGQSAEQEAGDVSEVEKDAKGPLRDRITPVSGHLFLKTHRFELSPAGMISLRDAFFTKYLVGGSLAFHLSEEFALSLHGGYAFPVVAGAAQICTTETTAQGSTRGCHAPRYEDIDGRAPGQIQWVGGLELQWAPIYGKISLLAEKFLHFDLYALAGPTAVQYLGPNATGGSTPEITVGGNVGLGMRFFANRFMTVRIELRDLIYVEKVTEPATPLRNQLLFELGLSFFLPTTFGED